MRQLRCTCIIMTLIKFSFSLLIRENKHTPSDLIEGIIVITSSLTRSLIVFEQKINIKGFPTFGWDAWETTTCYFEFWVNGRKLKDLGFFYWKLDSTHALFHLSLFSWWFFEFITVADLRFISWRVQFILYYFEFPSFDFVIVVMEVTVMAGHGLIRHGRWFW